MKSMLVAYCIGVVGWVVLLAVGLCHSNRPCETQANKPPTFEQRIEAKLDRLLKIAEDFEK